MRIINKQKETITEYDLTKGYLRKVKAPKEGVLPLGSEIVETKKGKEVKSIKRFYTKDELEDVQVYIPFVEPTPKEKIAELKAKLSATDYKVIKCCECYFTGYELPYDTEELHMERQAIREKINELEAQLCQS